MPTEIESIEELLAAPTEEAVSQNEDAQVADLLSEDKSETQTKDEITPEREATEDAEVEGENPEEAAELPSIDYALEVPMSDGTKVTLSELKDSYQSLNTKTDALLTRENEVMARISEAQELLSLVGNIPQEYVQQAREQQRQHLMREHELMVQVMPEMADPVQYHKLKTDVFSLAAEYGVEDVIGQVSDHRIVKMLRDFSTLRNNLKKATTLKPVDKAPKPKAAAVPRASSKDITEQLVAQAKKGGDHLSQVKAIDALLT
jgi:hypothetical protein